jgi:hypothetical protein
VNPTFASTRREAVFQSQTEAHSRSCPDDLAQSSTAHDASVAYPCPDLEQQDVSAQVELEHADTPGQHLEVAAGQPPTDVPMTGALSPDLVRVGGNRRRRGADEDVPHSLLVDADDGSLKRRHAVLVHLWFWADTRHVLSVEPHSGRTEVGYYRLKVRISM